MQLLLNFLEEWSFGRCGRTSTVTIPSPGRPNEATTPEMINRIHDKKDINDIIHNK